MQNFNYRGKEIIEGNICELTALLENIQSQGK
jgi:hypothetical protein